MIELHPKFLRPLPHQSCHPHSISPRSLTTAGNTTSVTTSLTGIPQKRPSSRHRISPPLRQNLRRLLPLRDHPHRTDHHIRVPCLHQPLLHGLGVEDLIPRPGIDLLPFVRTTARNLEPVDAVASEGGAERDGLRDVPLRDLRGGAEVFEPVAAGDADYERHCGRDEGAGQVDDFEEEARAVREGGAAVAVATLVGGGGEEAV